MIRVENLVKQFSRVRAVDGVSLDVGRGEILGLLGPNGAGKTTTLRTVLDILKPDGGTVRFLGEPLSERLKRRIGYLPEERGLYRNWKLLECLTYLGALKGLARSEAKRRASLALERAGLDAYAGRRIKELSKGMGQTAQFLAAIVHDPDLLMLDEPFQGLDPVNTDLLKTMLRDEQARGKAMILSSHNMAQVEELCDRILLIDHGRPVLYGTLPEIKAGYAEHAVVVECDRLPEGLHGVHSTGQHNRGHKLILEADGSPGEVLRQLVLAGVTVRRFEVAAPSLEEIFISAVGGAR